MDIHIGTADDVIASRRTEYVLTRATDQAVQVHSINPPQVVFALQKSCREARMHRGAIDATVEA
jgi:hypothetical protein